MKYLFNFSTFIFIWLLSDTSLATRLQESASRGTVEFVAIAQIGFTFGVALGACFMFLGNTGLGRSMILSSILGILAVTLAPAFMSFLSFVGGR
jgi:hypothetical protein